MFIHPEYERSGKDATEYGNDIALIKLNKSIPLKSKGPYTNLNGVCLPTEDTIPGVNQYAVMSGWGLTEEQVNNEGALQMGWTIISGTQEHGKLIKIYHPSDDRPAFCGVSVSSFLYSCQLLRRGGSAKKPQVPK